MHPREKERGHDQGAERVAQPPHPPQAGEAARRLNPAGAQAGDADRRAQHRARQRRGEQSQRVARAGHAILEPEAAKDRSADDRFERVADRDPCRDEERLRGRRVREEGPQKYAGYRAGSEPKQRDEREAGGRPDRADLRRLEREREPEAGRGDVEDGDAERHENVGDVDLPWETARGHDCD